MHPTLPDPNVSVLEKLYSSGAFFCLGILVLFFVLRYLTKHWSWLATGGRHVWAVAAVGGLATLVVPATQGTTPNANMLVMVMVTIIGISSDPKKIAALASALTLALVLSTSTGCGGALSRQKEIAATFVTVNAASDALVQYDAAHRAQIVADAKTHDAGQAALNAWDVTVTKILTDRDAAYHAIAAALNLNDDPSLAGMVQAALVLKTELTALGVLK